jgi:hypothetical protein
MATESETICKFSIQFQIVVSPRRSKIEKIENLPINSMVIETVMGERYAPRSPPEAIQNCPDDHNIMIIVIMIVILLGSLFP